TIRPFAFKDRWAPSLDGGVNKGGHGLMCGSTWPLPTQSLGQSVAVGAAGRYCADAGLHSPELARASGGEQTSIIDFHRAVHRRQGCQISCPALRRVAYSCFPDAASGGEGIYWVCA